MEKSTYEFKVHFGDTDAAGIVFYPNFYRWMDQASAHFFKTIGISLPQLIKEKKGLPILEAKCKFKSPLLFEDHVVVESSVKELRDKIFTIEHEFLKNDQVVAHGYEIRAWTDFSKDRPKAITIPNDVCQAIEGKRSMV
jgi:4-hydroxybenzoyl-CoA thioesterase